MGRGARIFVGAVVIAGCALTYAVATMSRPEPAPPTPFAVGSPLQRLLRVGATPEFRRTWTLEWNGAKSSFAVTFDENQYVVSELLVGEESAKVVTTSADVMAIALAVEQRLSADRALYFRGSGWEWFVTLDLQGRVDNLSPPTLWSF